MGPRPRPRRPIPGNPVGAAPADHRGRPAGWQPPEGGDARGAPRGRRTHHGDRGSAAGRLVRNRLATRRRPGPPGHPNSPVLLREPRTQLTGTIRAGPGSSPRCPTHEGNERLVFRIRQGLGGWPVADGIQIGRGFIAIDLDEAGAKASLDVLVEKIRETLREASKKTELDLDDTKADAELDKTNAKIKAVQQNAETPVTFGSGITRSARAAQQAIESASAAVVAARAKEETAAGRVRVAEQQLAEARAKFAADSSQVLRAEERLAAAERDVTVATEATRLAALKLDNARAAALDQTDVKVQKVKKDAKEDDPFKDWGKSLGNILGGTSGLGSILGLWAPAIAAVT